jgi:2-amino-4-hydroxy-6-hydroxymethyldihydropteridine diphosphokinase
VTRAYLALGSNLGDRAAHLQSAVDGLGAADGVRVVSVSRVYETDPIGGPEQDAYLNAVVAVDTALTPEELLALAHVLERNAERVRAERWGPRTLDVDVLLYDEVTIDTHHLTACGSVVSCSHLSATSRRNSSTPTHRGKGCASRR